jgi:glycosyltransferase involved in cell wall biosynthesis
MPEIGYALAVVIPVKDDAGSLAVCLRALARQTHRIAEIIVVDNGSVDDSAEVARRFGARVIYESEPGIAAAASRGYDSAVAGIIGRLDADSVPADDWAEKIVSFFSNHPAAAALTGSATFTDGPPALRRIGAFVYLGGYYVSVAAALGHWPLFGSNCGFRREAWQNVAREVHRDDLLTHDDMDLSFHLGPVVRIHLCPRVRVGISSRPFSDGKGGLRLRRGFHTIFIHWPRELPWIRIWRRLAAAIRASTRPGQRRLGWRYPVD